MDELGYSLTLSRLQDAEALLVAVYPCVLNAGLPEVARKLDEYLIQYKLLEDKTCVSTSSAQCEGARNSTSRPSMTQPGT